ncbi:hypothetical protein PLICRDRAFT_99626 [Plicaturopsis crispa FD-325 SS-3]|nr:hypothetical protein PLICRDRAFT_99626 [Plicaturopsis crispa FD-325 SS-3]
MASASAEDLTTLWTSLADEELTVSAVDESLALVQDDLWVAAACVDRLVTDPVVQRALLEVGLKRTAAVVERGIEVSTEALDNTDADGSQSNTKTDEEKRHDALSAHFRDAPADAQLCHIRATLLDRLDRLNTYVEIWKDAPGKKGAVVTEEEEDIDAWDDDPWEDGGAAESMTLGESTHSDGTPFPLPGFLSDDLLDIACRLGSQQQFTALRVLFERHGSTLWPYRLAILEYVPEYVHPSEYRDILLGYDTETDTEATLSLNLWRHEPEWVESPNVLAAVYASNPELPQTHLPIHDNIPAHPDPLPSSELSQWYKTRVDRVISATGMIDIALATIQHGASQGIPDLDELGEELSLLSRLVYDTHNPSADEEDWTLARWNAMTPLEVVRAYLASSTPDSLARDITRLVMPYLFVLESRAERAGNPDPGLPTRLLYDWILSSPLEMAAAVFEASKPTLPPAQRLLRNDEDIARLALACLYGSDSLDEWATMSAIFECLPAWDMPQDDGDEKDEADATIVSLGAFVTPSTEHPRCTAADLLVFFKPLPIHSLSRALDILDVHLESGEILARWRVAAPLRWFLQSSSDAAEQRAWANRMARRAGQGGEPLETQDDWNWLLEDMLKLSGSGESGLRGAFGLLDRTEVLQIFFGGLLSSGKFGIAKGLLRSSNKLALDATVIEDICLSCSREFYDNASSGNYNFGEMKLAYDCLDVPVPSERLLREKEFIEATSRLSSFNVMARPGIPISPIEIRLTKDRLSLVSRVLSSNSDAYKHTQVVLELVHKLGFRNDVVAEVKTLAMLADTALQAEDFGRAYEASEKMIDTVLNLRSSTLLGLNDTNVHEATEVCWIACFQLGRQPEFEDVPKKLYLLGRALELCPPDKLHDVLTAWRRLEKEDLESRQDRLVHRSTVTKKPPRSATSSSIPNTASALSSRLQEFRMPSSPLVNAEDAAALANRAFSRVAANFPFGGRGRSLVSDDVERSRSGSGSRRRLDAEEVSAQATRAFHKGIGWLIGADDE